MAIVPAVDNVVIDRLSAVEMDIAEKEAKLVAAECKYSEAQAHLEKYRAKFLDWKQTAEESMAREKEAQARIQKLQSDWLDWKRKAEESQEREKEGLARIIQNLQRDLLEWKRKAEDQECKAALLMTQEKLKQETYRDIVVNELKKDILCKNFYLEELAKAKMKLQGLPIDDSVVRWLVLKATGKSTSAPSAPESSNGASIFSGGRDWESPGPKQPPVESTRNFLSALSPSGSTTAGSNWAEEQDSLTSSMQSPLGPQRGPAGLDGDVSIASQDLVSF
jgi:hypothetical protein